jgi:hypothetical protein
MNKLFYKLSPIILHKTPVFRYMPKEIQLRNERSGYYLGKNLNKL